MRFVAQWTAFIRLKCFRVTVSLIGKICDGLTAAVYYLSVLNHLGADQKMLCGMAYNHCYSL